MNLHVECFIAAHMWFDNKIHDALTDEDIFDPLATRRVSSVIILQAEIHDSSIPATKPGVGCSV